MQIRRFSTIANETNYDPADFVIVQKNRKYRRDEMRVIVGSLSHTFLTGVICGYDPEGRGIRESKPSPQNHSRRRFSQTLYVYF